MRWIKQGLLYAPDGSLPWAQAYAFPATPLLIAADRLRIYVCSCDDDTVGRIGYVDVRPDDPGTILEVAERPVLDIGEPGCFDEFGLLPTCVLEVGDEVWMYYVGYSRGLRVPYWQFEGLARSRDGGNSFQRVQRVPVIDRSDAEPQHRTSAFVRRGGGWPVPHVVRGRRRVDRRRRQAAAALQPALRRVGRRHPLARSRPGGAGLRQRGRARLRTALDRGGRRPAAALLLDPDPFQGLPARHGGIGRRLDVERDGTTRSASTSAPPATGTAAASRTAASSRTGTGHTSSTTAPPEGARASAGRSSTGRTEPGRAGLEVERVVVVDHRATAEALLVAGQALVQHPALVRSRCRSRRTASWRRRRRRDGRRWRR